MNDLSKIVEVLLDDTCFISNIKVLKNINNISEKYCLLKEDIVNIKYHFISSKVLDSINIIKVDNMNSYIAKQILKRDFELLYDSFVFKLFKVKNSIFLVSDVKLYMEDNKKLHFSAIDTKKFIIENLYVDFCSDLSYMFSSCLNTELIILKNFNTQNVINFHNMFSNCSKLQYLDLTCLDTRKGVNFSYMFSNCFSLRELDLNNFEMPCVKSINNMFSNCVNLKILEIDTSFLKKKPKGYLDTLNFLANTPLEKESRYSFHV